MFYRFFLLFLPCWLFGQSYQQQIKAWQDDLNREFADDLQSPLPDSLRESFSGLAFYPSKSGGLFFLREK